MIELGRQRSRLTRVAGSIVRRHANTMTGPAQPKAMLAVAVLFAGAGLVLAQQAWVASPRVHVPPGVAYVVTALLFVAALMITFQVFGFTHWNDLLAAVLLAGITVEMLWFALGSGARPCSVGLWRPPEGVCRGAWGLCALICGVMTGWAIARHRARRRAD